MDDYIYKCVEQITGYCEIFDNKVYYSPLGQYFVYAKGQFSWQEPTGFMRFDNIRNINRHCKLSDYLHKHSEFIKLLRGIIKNNTLLDGQG